MKSLPRKEQIKILRRVLWAPCINCGMCERIYFVARDLGYNIVFKEVTKIIPTFNHHAYIKFYSKVRAVQIRVCFSYWDSNTIFGSLRRRWFIRHLIKELKK